MSFKLGKVIPCPSPWFTFRHIILHEKMNNRLAEQRLTIHAFSVRGTVIRAPTHGLIGMSVHLDTAKARMIHVNDNLPDRIFSGHLGTLGRGDRAPKPETPYEV
jgi:hypothetical protein